MFSNQKKNFFKSKWFYGILILALLVFGIWMNYGTESRHANTATKVEQETQTAAQEPTVTDSLQQGDLQETKDTGTEGSTEGTSAPSQEQQQAYYLIKEVEGVVKVFYCDETGQKTLYQITSIPFQLLSKEDQQLLTKGVQISTESELARFLENYDS